MTKKKTARFEPCRAIYVKKQNTNSRKTYVICGVPRGGTTMIAGIMQLCGLDLGENLPVNLEDPRFNLDTLSGRKLEKREAIIASITERNNSTTKTWGWKYPRAIAYLDDIKENLINPHLIIVLRDPMATAGRRIIRQDSPIPALKHVMRLQHRNIQLVEKWQVPTLLVSYERAIRNGERTIEQLCEFGKLTPPDDISDILRYITPGEYKVIE